MSEIAAGGDVRILCLNGGGARGLFTISVLAEIERIIEAKTSKTGVKAGDYFDLIAGTSIGGILALGLASGKSARELEAVFRSHAPEIFPPQKFPKLFSGFRKKLRLARRPLYDSAPLEKTIAEMVGKNTTFDDLNRRVIIPTVNLSTGKPQFFKTPHNPDFTRDGRLLLLDAAMATSAAPTYFAPHYCKQLDAYFADGGLIANNPALVGMYEVINDMKSDFPGVATSNIRILNIGTLGEEYSISPAALSAHERHGYLGLWGMGERLVLTTMTANQLLHKSMLQRELRRCGVDKNYLYLDDSIPNEAASDITLDNASESSLSNLAGKGRQRATEEFTINPRLGAFFTTPASPFKRQIPANRE
jgi:hypothetical protein